MIQLAYVQVRQDKTNNKEVTINTNFIIDPFIVIPGLTLDMTNKPPLAFFNLYFTSALKDWIHVETVHYAEQVLASMESYLHDHPNTRRHNWRRNRMMCEEVDPLLAIITLYIQN